MQSNTEFFTINAKTTASEFLERIQKTHLPEEPYKSLPEQEAKQRRYEDQDLVSLDFVLRSEAGNKAITEAVKMLQNHSFLPGPGEMTNARQVILHSVDKMRTNPQEASMFVPALASLDSFMNMVDDGIIPAGDGTGNTELAFYNRLGQVRERMISRMQPVINGDSFPGQENLKGQFERYNLLTSRRKELPHIAAVQIPVAKPA